MLNSIFAYHENQTQNLIYPNIQLSVLKIFFDLKFVASIRSKTDVVLDENSVSLVHVVHETIDHLFLKPLQS